LLKSYLQRPSARSKVAQQFLQWDDVNAFGGSVRTPQPQAAASATKTTSSLLEGTTRARSSQHLHAPLLGLTTSVITIVGRLDIFRETNQFSE